MEPFKYHVYICTQSKPEGVKSCAGLGAERSLAALKSELAKAGLDSEVQVTTCGCLGLCDRGPNMVVYPEGVWYSGVAPEVVPEIVSEHFAAGRPVARLVRADAPDLKKEILEHFAKARAMKELMEKAGVMPAEIETLMRGFMESRIMLTAIDLDVFSAVGPGAMPGQVARKIKAAPRSTATLLNALAALKALTKQNEKFFNTPLTSRFLVQGSPDYARDALMHMVHLWDRWGTMTAAVKKGSAVKLTAMKKRPKDATSAFIAAMHRNASFRAGAIASAIELAGVNKLLDVGGGSGAMSIALAKKKPGMQVTVFDLPNVIPLTRKYIAQAGLADAVSTQAGDMTKDRLGQDYDLALVSQICHMFSPAENLALFKRVRSALASNGRIVILDFVLNPDKTSPRMGAVFALNMLVNTRAGGTYSGEEYLAWLGRAGFADAKVTPLPGPASLVSARRP